jgi:hypothetical protein
MQAPPDSPFRLHARQQAIFCEGLAAPFTARLCGLLADRIDPASALGTRLDQWPGEPSTDALVLRLTGGLHSAARSGRAPVLAALYPPAPAPSDDALWEGLAPVLETPAFLTFLESAPQTNEVGRSAALAAGMLHIAARTGLPLSLLELGASAGLNLQPDRYDLQLGGTRAGDQASALAIAPEWSGPPPPAVPLRIADRRGVDLNPLSPVTDADRLLAYVWPDQPERLQRMRAALEIAAADPPQVDEGDAAAFTEAHARPKKGIATTVFHSIAFQYFPPDTQARIVAHMERAGAAASASAPLAWLRYEMSDPANPALPELRLTLWAGADSGEDELLAVGHPHGRSVRWRQ